MQKRKKDAKKLEGEYAGVRTSSTRLTGIPDGADGGAGGGQEGSMEKTMPGDFPKLRNI